MKQHVFVLKIFYFNVINFTFVLLFIVRPALKNTTKHKNMLLIISRTYPKMESKSNH